MATGVSTTKVGYRLRITLGAGTVPTSTEVSDFISDAEDTVDEIEEEATQKAKDTIIMKLTLRACEYAMKWQHNQGASSAGDEHTGNYQYESSYMFDWVTEKDMKFLRKSASRNTEDTVCVVGSFRRE